MFCHKCGNRVPEGTRFCNKCGANLIAREEAAAVDAPVPEDAIHATVVSRFCKKCGSPISDDSSFCDVCGNELSEEPAAPAQTALETVQLPAIAPQAPQAANNGGLRCPKCSSYRIQTTLVSNTVSEGGDYSKGKGCLGFLLLGPGGLLCGLCGKKEKTSTTSVRSHVCLDCGNRFSDA